jgi:integrase
VGRPQLEPGTLGKISTRNRGTWQARAKARTHGGRLVEVTGGGRTEEEAIEALKRRWREVSVFTGAVLTENSTFAEALDVWLADRRTAAQVGALKPQSYEQYVTNSRWVRDRIGAIPLHQVRPALMLGILQSIVADTSVDKKGRKQGGVARARKFRKVVYAVCAVAIDREAMSRQPLDNAKDLKQNGEKLSSLTPQQYRTMRESIIAWGTAPRRRSDWRRLLALLDVSMGTSLRIGEVLALRPIDIDLDADEPTLEVTGTIVEVKGKVFRQDVPKRAGQERLIPLPGPVARVLKERIAEVGDDLDALLFGTRTGEPDGNPSRLLTQWRNSPEGAAWVESVKLSADDVTFKLMRRTAGSRTRKALGLDAAQALMGHRHSATTERYYVEVPRVDSVTARALEDMWE